jgi:hypothetical protein
MPQDRSSEGLERSENAWLGAAIATRGHALRAPTKIPMFKTSRFLGREQ